LIDDGSTDNSGAICEELAQIDQRIVVCHKQNEGLGSARNMGLEIATGEYIGFYDVDDEIELNLIEKCVSQMEEKNVDLLVFGFYVYDENSIIVDPVSYQEKLVITNSQLKNIFPEVFLFSRHGNGFVWNKFYRKSFLDKYKFRFGKQRIQQDEIFNMQIYPEIERVFISSEILYHYYLYSQGNTRLRYIEDRMNIFTNIYDHFIKLYEDWDLNDKKIIKYINMRYFYGISNAILFNLYHPDSQLNPKIRRHKISKILESEKVVSCLKNIPKEELSIENKLYLFLFKHKLIFLISFTRSSLILLKKLLKN
jgi:glycosyltransferase involved in cell wall biosynthesis